MRLPVYELSAPTVAPEQLERIGSTLFAAEGLELQEIDGQLVGRKDSLVVALDSASGGVWAADEKRLWRPVPKPSLISEKEVYATAPRLLGEFELLPKFGEGEPFALARLPAGKSILAARARGKRTHRLLDLQARYRVTIRNPGIEGAPKALPIVGGGGKNPGQVGKNRQHPRPGRGRSVPVYHGGRR